jgi:ABC-type glycerol-3-phosphate transport system substrate-binding protein
MKKILSLLFILIILSVTGCSNQPQVPKTNLVYYKLYENNPNFTELLNQYQSQNPNINIIYKNFSDPVNYYNTIINEIAEGRGPDIMSVHNTWVAPNYAKLTPAPTNLVNPQDYQNIFLNQASKDNILTINNTQQVYGIPLYLDNLGLYYNQQHFEQTLPEDGKPSTTWTELQNQIRRLTITQDNQIQKSGIALGLGTNILRSTDIFYNFLLQTETPLYSNDLTSSNLSSSSEAEDTLNFITSFSNPDSENYSWSENFVSNESFEKEVGSFIKGETSMIFGYSYLYQEMLNLIQTYQRQGVETIDPSQIKISTSPQITPDEPVVYANYFTETVSRNSQNPNQAWALIGFLSSKSSLEQYYQNNFHPTSRRDMVEQQRQNRIYGPFIEQIGITDSFPIINEEDQKEIIKTLIDQYNSDSPKTYIQEADQSINQLIQGRALKPS